MKTKLFFTTKNVYAISQNEDGSLTISENSEGKSISNAGTFINNCGGIDAILAKCKDSEISIEDYKILKNKKIAENKRIEAQKRAEKTLLRNKEIESAYNELRGKFPVIPVTVENLRIIMQYLNTQNWGSWNLPKLEIGYSANQYDCDGKSAVTIKLDFPISDAEYGIENQTHFCVGAPRGHLNKYQRI